MDALNDVRLERSAAVIRDIHLRSADPDSLIVVRIDAHLAVIRAARIGFRHLRPRFSFVFAAKDAALRVLDQRVDHVAVAAIEVDADTADLLHCLLIRVCFFHFRIPRQTFFQFLPRRPAVGRLVQTAAGTAAAEAENRAAPLIRRGDERAGARRIHGDVADAGIVVDEENVCPRSAAVRCFIDAAIFRRTPEVSFGSNVHDIRIDRTDHDASDVHRLVQSHVLPRVAAVGRFVNAVAPRRALAIVRFAAADPDDRWIRWRDGDVADRGDRLVIE